MRDPYLDRHDTTPTEKHIPAPHYFQLPFRALLSQYGYLSAPLRPEPTGPAENAPQGEPQRSEGSPLLDLLP